MKEPGFALVAALVGCVGLAPASFAEEQRHKTSTRIEFVGLINGGQLIQIDLMPNRIPDYPSYRLQPMTLEGNLGSHRANPVEQRLAEAATRHQPKTAGEYMYPNMYPEKAPLAANQDVARRKAHHRRARRYARPRSQNARPSDSVGADL